MKGWSFNMSDGSRCELDEPLFRKPFDVTEGGDPVLQLVVEVPEIGGNLYVVKELTGRPGLAEATEEDLAAMLSDPVFRERWVDWARGVISRGPA